MPTKTKAKSARPAKARVVKVNVPVAPDPTDQDYIDRLLPYYILDSRRNEDGTYGLYRNVFPASKQSRNREIRERRRVILSTVRRTVNTVDRADPTKRTVFTFPGGATITHNWVYELHADGIYARDGDYGETYSGINQHREFEIACGKAGIRFSIQEVEDAFLWQDTHAPVDPMDSIYK